MPTAAARPLPHAVAATPALSEGAGDLGAWAFATIVVRSLTLGSPLFPAREAEVDKTEIAKHGIAAFAGPRTQTLCAEPGETLQVGVAG